MGKTLILVEGQTEERFVKLVLSDYFFQRDICLIPRIIETKEVKSGPNFKGGINSYQKIKKDLLKLLADSSAGIVTTMIDYYGLPRDFPSFNDKGNCYSKVKSAEESFARDISNPKFVPYLQLHEFEGILFSAPKAISSTMDTSGKSDFFVQRIRDQVSSPEEINDGPDTHPSKRILKLFPNYNKPFQGELISSRIGMDKILSDCPHFNSWVARIIEKSSKI